jgi:Histidinol dehydrogenase
MNAGSFDLEQGLATAGLESIPDEARAAAYAAMPADKRGVIKFTLSLVEGVCGRRADTLHAALLPDHGLGYSLVRKPAHWTFCLIEPGFDSAPRLAAALMLARLSGQEHVIAVRRGPAGDFPPALLTVLELTGIEPVFAAPGAVSDRAFALLREVYGPDGRMLVFGDSAEHLPAGCPVWRDTPPRLALSSANPDAEAVLRWAHPDATWSVPNDPALTALYCAEGSESGALRFGPGLEGCWLPPDLEADFFMRVRRTVRICRELADL